MESENWVQLSLDGNIEEAHNVQYRETLEARALISETVQETAEDLLPAKRIPAPESPGFERLDALMSILPDHETPESCLATYYSRER
jgi:hypothetical protein